MDEDYSIVIGLQNYPGLDDPANGQPALSGAENDANAFWEWVQSPDGGAVPKNNISLILSSDYPSTEKGFSCAKPAELEVSTAFDKLRYISNDNIKEGLGPKVGRRLYIFMSGHGITPTKYGTKNEREAALLMANTDPTNISAPRFHIPGTYAATWYCENECFEEVFLFMDCCRDVEIVPSMNTFFPPRGNADNAKRFYAFATRWSRRAKEKPMKDEQNKVRGIFSKTLLMGLSGAAAERDANNPEAGVITVASLKSYLYQNMKEFIDPEFRENPDVQEPDVEYSPKANEGRDIVIKRVLLKKFPVLIRIPAGTTGILSVVDDKLTPVNILTIKTSPIELPLNLPRGKYLAMLSGNDNVTSNIFDVRGIEEISSRKIVDFNV